MEQNVYDLVEVTFGDKKTTARPFEFEKDSKDNLVKPLKAITSCPSCGHGNEVDMSNWSGGILNAKCHNCGVGEEHVNNSLNANHNTVSVSLEQDILNALNSLDDSKQDMKPIIRKDKGIKGRDSKITIDSSNDVGSLKAECPFIDPIAMKTFILDEI